MRMNKKFMKKVALSLGIGLMGASSLGIAPAFAAVIYTDSNGQFPSNTLEEYQKKVTKEIEKIKAKEKTKKAEKDKLEKRITQTQLERKRIAFETQREIFLTQWKNAKNVEELKRVEGLMENHKKEERKFKVEYITFYKRFTPISQDLQLLEVKREALNYALKHPKITNDKNSKDGRNTGVILNF